MLEYPGFSSKSKVPAEVEDVLAPITVIESTRHTLSDLFVLVFREVFNANMPPEYDLGSGRIGARISSWTYSVALSMLKTAEILCLDCRFESHGLLDGLVETREEPRRSVIVAEWEWKNDTIFGPKKEIDKISEALRSHTTADGFLLTYCPIADYPNWLRLVVSQWQRQTNEQEGIQLYLITVLHTGKTFRELESIRTVQIYPSLVRVWDDLPLPTAQ